MIVIVKLLIRSVLDCFKSRGRLEAGGDATPPSGQYFAPHGAKAGPAQCFGSYDLGHALSSFPEYRQCRHDRPAGDDRALASHGLSGVVALEVPQPRRQAENRSRASRPYPAYVQGESSLGSPAHSWRVAEAGLQRRAVHGLEVHAQISGTTETE